jgi:molecular chaperone GrpE
MPNSPGSEEATTTAERDDQQERYDQLEDRYKRALADLDNYRKRASREIEQRVAESRDRLLVDWLDAVDSVERALQREPENPLAEGLRAVLDQMESILERQGVRRYGERGEPFDPERHEAVGVANSDELEPNTVADVARSGYARGNQVLRPAQVIVARRED